MKRIAIALMLVFGISATGSVFACESGHNKDKSGTTPPAATTKSGWWYINKNGRFGVRFC
jgi:hypothetical protein